MIVILIIIICAIAFTAWLLIVGGYNIFEEIDDDED